VTEAFDAIDIFWARLAVHIRAEHLHLFPAALKVSENDDSLSGVPELLELLRRDHNFFMHELAEAIRELRSVTAATAREVSRDVLRRLESVRDRLIEHNAVEEERIYPLRRPMVSRDADELLRSLETELNNLPPRVVKRNNDNAAA